MASRTRSAAVSLAGLVLFLGLAFSACAPVAPAPTLTPVPPTTTHTPSPIPSVTAAPTQTATLLSTATFTPTISPTPTPAAAFEQMQIQGVESIVGGVRVNLFLPGVETAYTLRIKDNQYTCTLVPEAKDHLFCLGLALVPEDEPLPVVLLDPASGAKVYASELIFSVPDAVLPAGYTHNWCEQRGEGVNCETECRQLPAGGYCVVATCTDACGLYFSIQTCPNDMSMDFTSCNEEQWAEAKRLYSIP